MEIFIIYLIGAIIAFVAATYGVLKATKEITLGDLFGIMFASVFSWAGFLLVIFTFDDVVIYKKK